MKFFPPLAKQSIAALAAIIFITSSVTFAQSPQPPANDTPVARQFNLLVLGDSILWGQGLKDEHKTWYQVRAWLQETANRNVRERIAAHSGAVIGSAADAPDANLTSLDGEVNRALPNINHELDLALKSYADPSQVDLVLVNGCINDVSALNLLNAGNRVEEIKALTSAKCEVPMEELLGRITSSFPQAHVIVTGYFPIISEKTPDNLLMRVVARLFYRSSPQSPRMKLKELHKSLVAISATWYQASNSALSDAVRRTNERLAAKASRQRVQFAEIPFPPEYSFAAKDTRLWGFNASFLRKLLAVVTLGRVTLGTNDERRKERAAICNQVFKPITGDPQKGQVKLRRMLCHYASIGHPNRKGAVIYAEAIITQLKSLITEIGWLRENRAISSGNSPVH